MAVIVKKFPINTGGEIHLAGSVINGLSQEEEQKLVDQGHCEFPVIVDSAAAAVSAPASDPSTADEFKSLKSAGQSAFLQKQGIEPGPNEPARIQQFTDWLAGDKGEAGGSAEEGGGPNTRLPGSEQ